jgi:hypothetical protein
MLPRNLPLWESVYYYLARWRDNGLLETINAALHRQLRTQLGHDPEPSIAILDSQTVKVQEKGGLRRRLRQAPGRTKDASTGR